MQSYKTNPALTLFSNPSPTSKRLPIRLGRVVSWDFNIIGSNKPISIKDQHGHVVKCGGFTPLQRKQLKAMERHLMDQPIAFNYQLSETDDAPINAQFITLVPNVKQWAQQQLKRTTLKTVMEAIA